MPLLDTLKEIKTETRLVWKKKTVTKKLPKLMVQVFVDIYVHLKVAFLALFHFMLKKVLAAFPLPLVG